MVFFRSRVLQPYLRIAACVLGVVWPGAVSAQNNNSDHDAAQAGTLIVFVDSGPDSALQQRFTEKTLPTLKKLAGNMRVGFQVFDVAEHGAAPAGVGVTPLIAFQNWRGRSIYQGRYATPDRVRNFVRTATFMPQGDAPLVRENVPIWDAGPAKIVTPTKVTPPTGPGAAAIDADERDRFLAAAPRIIADGMDRFTFAERVELGRSDRQWYINFYPYVADDGTLSVSTELYSQFHCHDPVFVTFDAPDSGPWAQRDAVLQRAAATLQSEIVRLLSESTLGDGYTFVAVPSKPWEALGLALPEKPATAAVDTADIALAQSWTVDETAQQNRPAVQFAFPAPLDGYSGEVTRLWGTLTLGETLTLDDAAGRFDADPDSVTMGEADLDDALRNDLLDTEKHPESFFVFKKIDVANGFAGQPLAFGQVVPAVLQGTFTMKGKTIPLSVPASIEAFVGRDGKPRISIDGTWAITLADPFGIEGPPGPKEASDTLRYRCHIVLRPKTD